MKQLEENWTLKIVSDQLQLSIRDIPICHFQALYPFELKLLVCKNMEIFVVRSDPKQTTSLNCASRAKEKFQLPLPSEL